MAQPNRKPTGLEVESELLQAPLDSANFGQALWALAGEIIQEDEEMPEESIGQANNPAAKLDLLRDEIEVENLRESINSIHDGGVNFENHIRGLDIPEIPVERRMELLAKYNVQLWKRELSPEERGNKIRKAEELSVQKGKRYMFDEATGNIVTGSVAGRIEKDPFMVSFVLPWGKSTFLLRSNFALRILAAADDAKKRGIAMQAAGGSFAFRTNEKQARAYYKWKHGISGIAGPPFKGHHQGGVALDLNNWKQMVKYMKRYGVTGGFENGIPNDPCHFSLSEACSAAKAERMERIYKAKNA